MQPINVKIKLREFDILVQNESSPDEPYLWVVYFKLDGTTLDIYRPEDSYITVYSPSGRHGNLGPDSYDEESSEAPLVIPKAVGEWNTTLDAVALMPQVIPACAVAALVLAFEEDMSTSTEEMEEGRRAFVRRLTEILNNRLRQAIRDIGNGNGVDLSEMQALPIETFQNIISEAVLKGITRNLLTTLFAGVPFLAALMDGDDFVGWQIIGPHTLPQLIGHPDKKVPFKLLMNNGEDADSGFYKVEGDITTSYKNYIQLGAWQTLQGDYAVIGRGANTDKFYRRRNIKGEGWAKSATSIGEGVFKSGPAAVVAYDRQDVYVFGQGMNDAAWFVRSSDGGKTWGGWKEIPAARFQSGLSAAIKGDGNKIYVVGQGMDNKYWWGYSTDEGASWKGWWPIGAGVFTSAPSICTSMDGKIVHVFGKGNDDRLYHAFSRDGGATWVWAWKQLLGQMASAPAAVCSLDGKTVKVFARNKNKRICHITSTNEGSTWLGWKTIDTGSFISSPIVTRSADMKQINLFGVGNNMNIYQNQSNDGGATWMERFYRVDEVGTYY